MNKQDKIQIAEEAMYLLEQAESLLDNLQDPEIDGYAIGHINAQRRYMGDGIYQIVENYTKRLNGESENC